MRRAAVTFEPQAARLTPPMGRRSPAPNHTDDMASIKETFRTLQERRRRRRATLPWAELEAEATRQGCSAADIFFDRAGRPVPGLPPVKGEPPAHAARLAPIPARTA
jgi:hypothetical protein